jgi:hypothetical protein
MFLVIRVFLLFMINKASFVWYQQRNNINVNTLIRTHEKGICLILYQLTNCDCFSNMQMKYCKYYKCSCIEYRLKSLKCVSFKGRMIGALCVLQISRFILWIHAIYTCRKHFPVLSSFTIYYRVCNKINTTGDTSGAGNAYPSGAPEFTPGF